MPFKGTIRIQFNSRNVRVGANGAAGVSRTLTGVELHDITHTDISTHQIFRERDKDDEQIFPLKRYELRDGERFYSVPLKINNS
jgi:hypothetical protein